MSADYEGADGGVFTRVGEMLGLIPSLGCEYRGPRNAPEPPDMQRAEWGMGEQHPDTACGT